MTEQEQTMEILKPYLIEFDKLKVGDKLWAINYGYVKVMQVLKTSFQEYSVTVENSSSTYLYFLPNGKECHYNEYPTLFKSNPFIGLAVR